MRYEKPEMLVLAPAAAAIQSGHKGTSETIDMSSYDTVGAYESDE